MGALVRLVGVNRRTLHDAGRNAKCKTCNEKRKMTWINRINPIFRFALHVLHFAFLQAIVGTSHDICNFPFPRALITIEVPAIANGMNLSSATTPQAALEAASADAVADQTAQRPALSDRAAIA